MEKKTACKTTYSTIWQVCTHTHTFLKTICSHTHKTWTDIYVDGRIIDDLKMGFPCGSPGIESTHNAGDLGSIPGLGRSPGEGKGPTPVFWPGEFHGLYSPWGRKEADTTEQLSLSLSKISLILFCIFLSVLQYLLLLLSEICMWYLRWSDSNQ